MSNIVSFNCEVLKSLLSNYEVTEEQLATKLNVSSSKVRAWIEKTNFPTYNQLIKIAESFKKPVIIFFMQNPPIEGIQVDFRSSQEFVSIEDKKRIGELIDTVKTYQTSLEDLFTEDNRKCNIVKWSTEYLSNQSGFNQYLRNELDFSFEKQC